MNIEKILTSKNYSVAHNRKIKYIVVHYVGAVSTARNNAIYFKDIDRGASAHYFVDESEIIQVVEDENISWHCGSSKYYCNARNTNSIGIEMCCYRNSSGELDISDKVIENTIQLIIELMNKYDVNVKHVIRHYDVSHKICPAPFVKDEAKWITFKKELSRRHNIPVKSVIELAQEVLIGKWGNGAERKQKLQLAGYDYELVQSKVNQLLEIRSIQKKNEVIADEVIRGEWGNGAERKKKLEGLGYDYNTIQKIVNQKLS